jgi:hypothetical protein
MSNGPHRFILQALDPDHGSPVLEALFLVPDLDELRALLDIGDDYPEFGTDLDCYLDGAELAALNARFGVHFDPDGREVRLTSWHHMRLIPYLVHTGYELPLLLEGLKPFARMKDAYPPHRHMDEDKFDSYVAQGILHKEVVVEPFEQSTRLEDGRVFEGVRTVCYTHKGEEWRIPASKLMWDAAAKSVWNDDFERMEGMLFGYEEWQNDWWLADNRRRRGSFGCAPVCRVVSAEDLAWIDAAGYRALPPTQDPVLTVNLAYDSSDDDAAQRLIESSGAVALIRFSVKSRAFLDLVDGQSGPDYAIPAERIRELNRNIVGEIEVIARAAGGVAEL